MGNVAHPCLYIKLIIILTLASLISIVLFSHFGKFLYFVYCIFLFWNFCLNFYIFYLFNNFYFNFGFKCICNCSFNHFFSSCFLVFVGKSKICIISVLVFIDSIFTFQLIFLWFFTCWVLFFSLLDFLNIELYDSGYC